MQTAVSYQNGHDLCNVITGLSLVEPSEGTYVEAKAFIFISFSGLRNKLQSKISNFQAVLYYSRDYKSVF
jgi:hypothetical protein